jgi:hypothetical protein
MKVVFAIALLVFTVACSDAPDAAGKHEQFIRKVRQLQQKQDPISSHGLNRRMK